MFVSTNKRIINTSHIETIETIDTNVVRIAMSSGRILHIENDEASELFGFMEKRDMVHRSRE